MTCGGRITGKPNKAGTIVPGSQCMNRQCEQRYLPLDISVFKAECRSGICREEERPQRIRIGKHANCIERRWSMAQKLDLTARGEGPVSWRCLVNASKRCHCTDDAGSSKPNSACHNGGETSGSVRRVMLRLPHSSRSFFLRSTSPPPSQSPLNSLW